MSDEERIARELQSLLGGDARVVGERSVMVAHAFRHCEISCIWYGEAAGLMLGMNPRNARTVQGPTYRARRGAEYLVRFHDAKQRIAGGRTDDVAAAIGAIREWLAGRSIADVGQSWPFVDATRRGMRELLAVVAPTCSEGALRASFRGAGDTVAAIRLWLEHRCTVDQLAQHPSTVTSTVENHVFDPD